MCVCVLTFVCVCVCLSVCVCVCVCVLTCVGVGVGVCRHADDCVTHSHQLVPPRHYRSNIRGHHQGSWWTADQKGRSQEEPHQREV